MPLQSIGESIELYYEISSPNGSSKLDPSVPVLVLLSPLLGDLTALAGITEDPRAHQYSIVAIDSRGHGRSKSPPEPHVDPMTMAVDIARLLDILRVPPCHLFAPQCLSGFIGSVLAVLFPRRFLSISYAGGFQFNLSSAEMNGWMEVNKAWSFPEEPEEELEAMEATAGVILNEHVPGAYKDMMMGMWKRRYCLAKITDFYQVSWPLLNGAKLTAAEFALIRIPVLLMHGSKDHSCAMEKAVELHDAFVNAEEVQFELIRHASHALYATHYEQVNDLLFDFIHEHSQPVYQPDDYPEFGFGERFDFKSALYRLADFSGDRDISERDPKLSRSFTRMSEEEIEERTELIARLREQEASGFSFEDAQTPEPWQLSRSESQAQIELLRSSRRPSYATEDSDPLSAPSSPTAVTGSLCLKQQQQSAIHAAYPSPPGADRKPLPAPIPVAYRPPTPPLTPLFRST